MDIFLLFVDILLIISYPSLIPDSIEPKNDFKQNFVIEPQQMKTKWNILIVSIFLLTEIAIMDLYMMTNEPLDGVITSIRWFSMSLFVIILIFIIKKNRTFFKNQNTAFEYLNYCSNGNNNDLFSSSSLFKNDLSFEKCRFILHNFLDHDYEKMIKILNFYSCFTFVLGFVGWIYRIRVI
ncbi:unnamed protein product [Brachionus calyciflorus]|uniref:Uncharacterized protein n=1 Tax=Brachionus calyciflorus TaxID=104777 RepID=A0A814IDL7_9BILA|nr:unnamed protein product [Brachionus calyciflorus]